MCDLFEVALIGISSAVTIESVCVGIGSAETINKSMYQCVLWIYIYIYRERGRERTDTNTNAQTRRKSNAVTIGSCVGIGSAVTIGSVCVGIADTLPPLAEA